MTRPPSTASAWATPRAGRPTEMVVLDALTLCNSCDAAPALPDDPAGYCRDCLIASLDHDPDDHGGGAITRCRLCWLLADRVVRRLLAGRAS